MEGAPEDWCPLPEQRANGVQSLLV